MSYYFDTKTWTISLNKTEKSIKLPILAVILLAPVLGGLFAFFLPALGFYLLFDATVIRPVKKWCRRRDSNPQPTA